jgi:hypothetical protein
MEQLKKTISSAKVLLIEEIKEAMKLVNNGKKKTRPLKDLLNGL